MTSTVTTSLSIETMTNVCEEETISSLNHEDQDKEKEQKEDLTSNKGSKIESCHKPIQRESWLSPLSECSSLPSETIADTVPVVSLCRNEKNQQETKRQTTEEDDESNRKHTVNNVNNNDDNVGDDDDNHHGHDQESTKNDDDDDDRNLDIRLENIRREIQQLKESRRLAKEQFEQRISKYRRRFKVGKDTLKKRMYNVPQFNYHKEIMKVYKAETTKAEAVATATTSTPNSTNSTSRGNDDGNDDYIAPVADNDSSIATTTTTAATAKISAQTAIAAPTMYVLQQQTKLLATTHTNYVLLPNQMTLQDRYNSMIIRYMKRQRYLVQKDTQQVTQPLIDQLSEISSSHIQVYDQRQKQLKHVEEQVRKLRRYLEPDQTQQQLILQAMDRKQQEQQRKTKGESPATSGMDDEMTEVMSSTSEATSGSNDVTNEQQEDEQRAKLLHFNKTAVALNHLFRKIKFKPSKVGEGEDEDNDGGHDEDDQDTLERPYDGDDFLSEDGSNDSLVSISEDHSYASYSPQKSNNNNNSSNKKGFPLTQLILRTIKKPYDDDYDDDFHYHHKTATAQESQPQRHQYGGHLTKLLKKMTTDQKEEMAEVGGEGINNKSVPLAELLRQEMIKSRDVKGGGVHNQDDDEYDEYDFYNDDDDDDSEFIFSLNGKFNNKKKKNRTKRKNKDNKDKNKNKSKTNKNSHVIFALDDDDVDDFDKNHDHDKNEREKSNGSSSTTDQIFSNVISSVPQQLSKTFPFGKILKTIKVGGGKGGSGSDNDNGSGGGTEHQHQEEEEEEEEEENHTEQSNSLKQQDKSSRDHDNKEYDDDDGGEHDGDDDDNNRNSNKDNSSGKQQFQLTNFLRTTANNITAAAADGMKHIQTHTHAHMMHKSPTATSAGEEKKKEKTEEKSPSEEEQHDHQQEPPSQQKVGYDEDNDDETSAWIDKELATIGEMDIDDDDDDDDDDRDGKKKKKKKQHSILGHLTVSGTKIITTTAKKATSTFFHKKT